MSHFVSKEKKRLLTKNSGLDSGTIYLYWKRLQWWRVRGSLNRDTYPEVINHLRRVFRFIFHDIPARWNRDFVVRFGSPRTMREKSSKFAPIVLKIRRSCSCVSIRRTSASPGSYSLYLLWVRYPRIRHFRLSRRECLEVVVISRSAQLGFLYHPYISEK